ncbi:MAG: NADH-quinone oxidoreductase subunit A [Desulfurococcales archaeon]|nr:NADH-quinone oxidoreductase subunit A [Desulfurococcales archaeon]
MLEMLENALVKSTTSLVVLPVILIIVMIAVVLFLERITRAAEEINKKEPWKYWRYDAANPSKDRDVRKKVSMQYLGYLIIFLAVEPAVILLALLSTASRESLPSLLKVFGVFLAVYTPLLIYAVNESRKVESWMLD